MRRMKWLSIVSIFLLLALSSRNVYAADSVEKTLLYSMDDIDLYLRHGDYGNYCFILEDIILTEEEAEEIFSAPDLEESLFTQTQFRLRKKGTYERIDNQYVSVDYVEILNSPAQTNWAMEFSYNDGVSEMSITAYAYILKNVTEDTETEKTETEESEETEEPEEPETEDTETAEETAEPQTKAAVEEEVNEEVVIVEETIILENRKPEKKKEMDTERETESQTQTKVMEETVTEVPKAVELKPPDKKGQKKENKEQEISKGFLGKMLDSRMYVATFSAGAAAFFSFFTSIYSDLKVLSRHRKGLKKQIKKQLAMRKKE